MEPSLPKGSCQLPCLRERFPPPPGFPARESLMLGGGPFLSVAHDVFAAGPILEPILVVGLVDV